MAVCVRCYTVKGVHDERAFRQQLLTTTWCSSWFGRCRIGDRFDPAPDRRAAAWGQWAVASAAELTGSQHRTYPAIVLEGRFHDPKGTGPLVKPHLEIPGRVLSEADGSFPDRVSQLGNALAFPWWLVPEVTAARRALFNTPGGAIDGVVDALNSRRGALVAAVHELALQAAPKWALVEELLVADSDAMCDVAAGDFGSEDVGDFLPSAREFSLSAHFDEKLRTTAGNAVSRRLGVWQLHGTDANGARFAFGVMTPRLTANSQFNDRHFALERESPASLLVRGLVLRRLLARHLGGGEVAVLEKGVEPVGVHLRGVVAQVGQKLPEASQRAAVQFVQTYPDCDRAWEVLSAWAERTNTLLTIREEAFREAHRRATRFIRRAEEPDRDDVNVLLPLGWDDKSRVVRVTFTKRAE